MGTFEQQLFFNLLCCGCDCSRGFLPGQLDGLVKSVIDCEYYYGCSGSTSFSTVLVLKMHVVKSYDYPFNFCSCLLQPDQITLGIMDGNVALIVNAGLSDIIMKTSEDYNDGEWHFATVKQERSK